MKRSEIVTSKSMCEVEKIIDHAYWIGEQYNDDDCDLNAYIMERSADKIAKFEADEFTYLDKIVCADGSFFVANAMIRKGEGHLDSALARL